MMFKKKEWKGSPVKMGQLQKPSWIKKNGPKVFLLKPRKKGRPNKKIGPVKMGPSLSPELRA